jgi:hypothetical protein
MWIGTLYQLEYPIVGGPQSGATYGEVESHTLGCLTCLSNSWSPSKETQCFLLTPSIGVQS